MSHDDFDTEPIPGLPSVPPVGEAIVWQGSPHWPTVARRVMHIDLIALYLAAVLAWRMASAHADGATLQDLAASASVFALISSVAIGILIAIAWGIGRTTIYTITSRRIVLRFGIALPVTFNLPFRAITAVDVRKLAHGRGEICLRLERGTRLAFLVLWPHVRPWRINAPEPMLRAIPLIDEVAAKLGEALATDLTRTTAVSMPQAVVQPGLSSTASTPTLIAAE